MPKFEDFDTDDLAGGAGSGGTATLFPEGLTFPNFNDDARASLAAIRRYAADTLMSEITTTGTGSAYTLTLTETLYTILPGASDPHKFIVFNPHADCADDATLNVNATGAENILHPFTGANVKKGDILQSVPVMVVRRPATTGWVLITPALFPGELTSFTADATEGPEFSAYRDNSAVAADDLIGVFAFKGEDSASNKLTYAKILAKILDPTTTAEDAELLFYSIVGGTLGARLHIGNGAYTPNATDGDKGADTINASGIYDDGLLLRGTPIAILEEQQTSGTDGGTFTSGADRTRKLTTEVFDPYSLVSIASNQFTLQPGTYLIKWSAPAFRVNAHQSMLYDVDGLSVIARGSTEDSGRVTGSESETITVQTRSEGAARVTISAANIYEIRHRCETTSNLNGFGAGAGFGTEVYTRVEIYAA